jgi:phosphatidate cytidylyltransferase
VLIQRVVTAVILLAILGGALAWSPAVFALLVTLAIVAATVEWLQLVGWGRGVALAIAITLGVLLVGLLHFAGGLVLRAVLPAALFATIIWLGVAGLLMQGDALAIRLPRAAATVLAILLLGAAWIAVVHFLLQGAAMLLSVFVIVWIADTAAYFAGRAFGRTKLAADISPGKTWGGVYGAIVAVLTAAIAAWILLPTAPIFTNRLLDNAGLPIAVLLIVALVSMSIFGDLFESLLKRQAGVKDSSHLLPGHGGVYDRIDALVPLLPLAALIDGLAR